MVRRSWLVLGLCLLTFTQLGCKSGLRSKRVLRQPAVEEYNLPPSEGNLSEGPYYPDQKRQLPSQVREQEKALGMGGRAGAGMGGGGGAPTGMNGNGAPGR